MDKELIKVLSDLFDEKLKPIREEIESLKKTQERIEKKINSIDINIDDIRNDIGHMEVIVAKNRYDMSKYIFNQKER